MLSPRIMQALKREMFTSFRVCDDLVVDLNSSKKIFIHIYCYFLGPTCSKSAATQMSELISYLNANCKSQW